MTLILGIETSCDETSAAVVEDAGRVRSNVVASQHELHRKYQGVVPEIASRAHIERITPVTDQALKSAGVQLGDLDAIAVGNRPGLIGSLLVGVEAAKMLAWATDRPLIGIDHIQAHLYAASLSPADQPEPERQDGPAVAYPALGLVVSGGHTCLFEVVSSTTLSLLGQTIDDAVGEAYDKAAVILDAGYPGGPCVDQLAQRGNPMAVAFPRSMLGETSLDFSFSGLKTSLLYTVRGHPQGRGRSRSFPFSSADLSENRRADLAASFQAAAVDSLIIKIERAIDQLAQLGRTPTCLIIGGGVSANSLLRRRSIELGRKRGLPVHLPPLAYCLDNAAMIAGLAQQQYDQRRFDDLHLPALASRVSPATSSSRKRQG